MGYRLTAEERRIIERTRREGEQLYASQTPAQKKEQMWRGVLVWVGAILAFALIGMLIVWAGSLVR